jgi:hypothetical protein
MAPAMWDGGACKGGWALRAPLRQRLTRGTGSPGRSCRASHEEIFTPPGCFPMESSQPPGEGSPRPRPDTTSLRCHTRAGLSSGERPGTSTRTAPRPRRNRDGNGRLLPAPINAGVCALPTPTPCAVMGSNRYARRQRPTLATPSDAEVEGRRTRGASPARRKAQPSTHKSRVNSSSSGAPPVVRLLEPPSSFQVWSHAYRRQWSR